MNQYLSDDTVKEFIIENHSTMTNKEIAKVFNRKTMQIAGFRHHLKKSGELKELEDTKDELNKLYYEVGKFKNVSAKGKLEARQVMAKHIGTHAKVKKPILTLPFKLWEMEKLVQNYTGKLFTYVACEKNLDVFIEMCNNSKKYGKNNELYHGLIGDKIEIATEGKYSHLILDYCGVLSSFSREISLSVINNVVEVGGTISITLQKGRDSSDILDKCYEASDKTTNKTEDAIRTFFKSLCLISNFEVVDELIYCDKTPMMLTVLKRMK